MGKEKLIQNKWFLTSILFLGVVIPLEMNLFWFFFEANILINTIISIFIGLFYTKITKNIMPSKLKWTITLITGLFVLIYLIIGSNKESLNLMIINLGFSGVLIFYLGIYSLYVLPSYGLLTLGSSIMGQKLKK